MNYLDLFSGIGGFHLGLQQAGFKFNWCGHSEIDKYAKQIYQKHFSESEDLGDVSNINVSELPEIDLVTFGFPCQDLSVAGKRGGLSASRSGLFYQAIRIIEVKRPSYFIFENVKGLFSSNGGRDFHSVLRAIADIGYDGQWQLLNTRWFLPQNRERIYFVGYPRERGGQQIFPIGESSSEIRQERDGENIAGCLSTRSGSGQSNFDGSTTLIGTYRTHKDDQGFREIKDGNCPTIPVRAREDGSGQPVIMKRETKDGFHFYRNDNKKSTIQGTHVTFPEGKAHCLNTNHIPMTTANCVTPDAYLTKGERNRDENGKAILTSMCDRSIRRLTPIECERLQGFPDNWTEGISDTQRYKCLGNAVSVPVVKAVGVRIKPHPHDKPR